MERESRAIIESDAPHRSHVNAALIVSVQSVGWTLVASSAAVVIGLRSHTAVLVAFGAIGYVDLIGSVALVHHFRHGLRHEELSDDLEKLAHRIVLIGLLLVGAAAIAGGLARFIGGQTGDASNSAVVLASISLAALILLSARKQTIARRVSSNALRSDGHLSAIGAMQAAVALAGTAAARWAGWDWADAVATMAVGGVAVTLAVVTWRAEAGRGRAVSSSPQIARVAFVLVSTIAVVDALLGPRLILIGLLVVGPALTATSLRPLATAVISTWSVVLAVILGAPDHIWFALEHAMWMGAVLLVGVANTAVVTVAVHHRRNPPLTSSIA